MSITTEQLIDSRKENSFYHSQLLAKAFPTGLITPETIFLTTRAQIMDFAIAFDLSGEIWKALSDIFEGWDKKQKRTISPLKRKYNEAQMEALRQEEQERQLIADRIAQETRQYYQKYERSRINSGKQRKKEEEKPEITLPELRKIALKYEKNAAVRLARLHFETRITAEDITNEVRTNIRANNDKVSLFTKIGKQCYDEMLVITHAIDAEKSQAIYDYLTTLLPTN